MSRLRVALSVTGSLAVLCSVTAGSSTSQQTAGERLRIWTTAVQRHHPGQLDDSVSNVAKWTAGWLSGALGEYLRLNDRNDLGALRFSAWTVARLASSS